jgi:hypothetical protein
MIALATMVSVLLDPTNRQVLRMSLKGSAESSELLLFFHIKVTNRVTVG